jgi:ubiquinone/menaquinone biosynthesis C-methylase UbiE
MAGADITGIDFSEALIKEALKKEETQPLGIQYFVADAANLYMLESDSFDIAFCHMALQDIRDYEEAISEASRVLKIGGQFVVLIPHPCFTVPRFIDGKVVSGWESRLREDGSKEYLYCRVDNYFYKRRYAIEWGGSRLSSSFVTTSFHRTLSDYVNAMTKHGLIVSARAR